MSYQSSSVLLDQLGWINVQLDKEIIDFLWKRIDKSKKESAKKTLAGNISQSYSITDENNYFFEKVLYPLCMEYVHNQTSSINNAHNLTLPVEEDMEIYLHSFWVNHQKKYEINPIHDHTGLFSFVIWMKIPYDCEEQIKLPFLNGVMEENRKAGTFEFQYMDMYGKIVNHSYMISPEFEGRMLFFPSNLRHMVYPFYECDEDRISISGNIWSKPIRKKYIKYIK